MSKETSVYRKNAEECRDLARQTTRPEDKAKLEKMAEAWEQLAGEGPLKVAARHAAVLVLARSGRAELSEQRPLSSGDRTRLARSELSASDPQQTSALSPGRSSTGQGSGFG